MKSKSVTDQYRDASVVVTTGHNSDLKNLVVPIYSQEEHGTWALMFKRQMEALPQRVSQEYLDALQKLNLPADRIPRLLDVSNVLEKSTGWKLTRVEGLVPEKEFFELLSQKLFPCTDFIRKREELEYTPSPDMFHDIFGHIPLITNQTFANFYEFFGKVAARATPEQVVKLQRIYWFSVEFGLIKNKEGLRIYGSGILSSVGEVIYSLGNKVRVHPFDFEKVANQEFEIHHMQDDLFFIDSFDSLLTGFKEYSKTI
ncbi:MAG: phenylalanine 4-monooxygenase [Deltaproteobacteria bacterium]|nr:phenylalanine 4-monooxygenase [Deltaproteobacteria bacterium]